jgi:hypothetical protein
MGGICLGGRHDLVGDPNVDGHVVLKVLVPRDQGIAGLVLETHAMAIVEAEEVFDGCDDGVGAIVREDVDSQGEPGTLLAGLGEQVLETNVLRGLIGGGEVHGEDLDSFGIIRMIYEG